MKKLYVGNLPHQATEAELEAWFLRAGIRLDTINIVRDRFSGGRRGFGFVEIANDEEAARAIAECDGRDFLGRQLAVNEARPRREDRPARDMRRRRSFSSRSRHRRIVRSVTPMISAASH